MVSVERRGMAARGLDRACVDAWVRVVAGARLSEGFAGEYAEFLRAVACGERRLDE